MATRTAGHGHEDDRVWPSRPLALPGFDEYMLGFKDRAVAVAAEHQGKIIPGGNGMFMPTLVGDGIVVGTWRRTLGKTTVLVEPLPFHDLSPAARADFGRVFARYGKYLGVPCKVDWA